MAVYDPAGQQATALAEVARHWGLEGGADGTAWLAVVADGRPVAARVPIHAVPLDRALPALLALRVDAVPAYRRRPDTVRTWALAARLAVRLVGEERIVPTLHADGDGVVHGAWRTLAAGDDEACGLLVRLSGAMPRAGHAVVVDGARIWEPQPLVAAFLDGVADLAVRAAHRDTPRTGRPRERLLPWTARWAEALVDGEDARVPLRHDADELVAGVGAWLGAAAREGTGGIGEYRLDAPPTQEGVWRLSFGVREESGSYRPAAEVWDASAGGDPAQGAAQETLLRALGLCARVYPPIETALRQAAPDHVELGLEQAWSFIREAAPLLSDAGLIVELPAELTEHELHARLRVGAGTDDGSAPGGQAKHPPEVAYVWEVALGDVTLTPDELGGLLKAGAPLVRWRGHWVRVDPDEVRRLSDLGDGGLLPWSEALALALTGLEDGGGGRAPAAVPAEVVADGPIAALVDRLLAAGHRPDVPAAPPGFAGQLRPYQRRGVAWLDGMGELELGAVLADEMGLGKTPTLIAYLLVRDGDGPHLVVCPTSVVGNWEREIRRFAPHLKITRHHGASRAEGPLELEGVVLTTYGTLRRDADLLAAVDWDVVTLDEAQHVKNPTTAGARAVRRLRAEQKVALTGTPLENRLAELWSLLDATNPGLLGSRARFTRRYVTPVEKRRDPEASARLRRLVAPFVLRREKADPDVALDLPPKIERTVPCAMTPEQAELYEAAVKRVLGTGDGLADASGIQRRGRILALLTELKQVCNHPAHALREDGPLVGRSGKLAAAREIVVDAADAGGRVLVFTQYVEMARLLAAQLGEDLRTAVPVLHGGVAAHARDRMVAQFQGETEDQPPPVLVVSLRAGGTGLNLTAANHVVHYDRWWNPAVEDQATDRAHRIGQHRPVEVHKLVTAGTVEERIAEVLEGKRALAGTVVGAGETWITELNDAEIADLVALSGASVTDLDDDEFWDPLIDEEAS